MHDLPYDMNHLPDPTRTGPLSKQESTALAVCEAAIQEHIGAWVNVTNAFAEIATNALYRETHPTFEAYCRDRWGLSRSHGHRLVLLSRVQMSPMGDRISNERQAREIATLLDDPDLLRQVVERAEEIRRGKPLTAAALRQARAELTLTPEEAEISRRVYDAAEWTQEKLIEWEERAARIASRYVEELPLAEVGWGYNLVQRLGKSMGRYASDKAAGEGLALRLAMDAPLTEPVLLIVRQYRAGVISGMSSYVSAMDSGAEAFGALAEGFPSSPFPEAERGLRRVVPMLSERMAEVLTALAEVEDGREWTPAETEEAKAAFEADIERMAAADELSSWLPGPLMGGAAQIGMTMKQSLDTVLAKLSETRKKAQ